MTTLKESSNRVHKFEKNGWLELYLPTSKQVNKLTYCATSNKLYENL